MILLERPLGDGLLFVYLIRIVRFIGGVDASVGLRRLCLALLLRMETLALAGVCVKGAGYRELSRGPLILCGMLSGSVSITLRIPLIVGIRGLACARSGRMTLGRS